MGDLLGRESLPLGGIDHPVADELREAFFIEVLQLASAASAKVAARRLGTMRSGCERTVVAQHVAWRGKRCVTAVGGDAVAFGGDPDDFAAHSAAA